MNVLVVNDGCERRQLDSARLKDYFGINGCTLVKRPQDADLIVIVTCAFNQEKEDLSIELIRHYQQYTAEVVVLGCLPAIAPQRLATIHTGKSLPTVEHHRIDEWFPEFSTGLDDIADATDLDGPPKWFLLRKALRRSLQGQLGSRMVKRLPKMLSSTGHLRISYGCLGDCTYCGIRNAIGRLKSKPLAQILLEYQTLLERGCKRIRILADDTGAWGLDTGSSLPLLLSALDQATARKVSWELDQVHPVWAVRYQDALRDLIASGRIDSMLVSVQSGSPSVLRSMRRFPDVDKVRDALAGFTRAHKDFSLLTDVIVGFPGETDEDFGQTVALLLACGFAYVNIFGYTDREVCDARNLDDKVPRQVIDRRIHTLTKALAKADIRHEVL
ncbi:hypothetical protein AUJ68_06150 [Candidatus Woesearchaeota archaeon CG1_02_57_44]|nr:MAG: hypothetical protein AUJ68_06150 [Candidatus Woesearchaeota archaeon CG1_02_57_44]